MSNIINFRGIQLHHERSFANGWSIYKRPKPEYYVAVSPEGAIYSSFDNTLAGTVRFIKARS